MLKTPGYQMVQENSKYKDSFFYQIDHASRKSFFNIFTLGSGVPYMRQEGLPGKYLVKFHILPTKQSDHYTSSRDIPRR